MPKTNNFRFLTLWFATVCIFRKAPIRIHILAIVLATYKWFFALIVIVAIPFSFFASVFCSTTVPSSPRVGGSPITSRSRQSRIKATICAWMEVGGRIHALAIVVATFKFSLTFRIIVTIPLIFFAREFICTAGPGLCIGRPFPITYGSFS